MRYEVYQFCRKFRLCGFPPNKKGALRPPRETEMVQGRLTARNNNCPGLGFLL
jgi:hypothetical protein